MKTQLLAVIQKPTTDGLKFRVIEIRQVMVVKTTVVTDP
jgi:hypothetical protein